MPSPIIERIRRRSFAERYLATAAVVWLLYGTLSAALLHTGLATWLAGGLAYCLALCVHFSLHRFVVFRRDELEYHHDLSKQVTRYLLTAVAQYSFTLAGTALLVANTDLHRSVAYVGCAAFAAVLNFLALKLLVFPHASDEAKPPSPIVHPPSAKHGDAGSEPVTAGSSRSRG